MVNLAPIYSIHAKNIYKRFLEKWNEFSGPFKEAKLENHQFSPEERKDEENA